MRPTFLINHLAFDHTSDVLVVELESDHYGRNYAVSWTPERTDGFRVLRHWSHDCIESTEALPRAEWLAIERFVDASDAVAEAFWELGSEFVPPQRRAVGE